ncbi:MAG: GNAT family N-acetyltransferase [Dehalococcoidia bacterium]
MRDNDTSVETLKAAPKAFYDAVLPFLAEAEAENTLLIGISSRLAARDMPDSPEAFFWVVRDGDEICGAAMWTPPHDLVLSHPFSDAALDTLSEFLLRMQLPLPGVLGPDDAASKFALQWTTARNLTAHLWRRERIYCLQRVEPLPWTEGHMIQAEPEHMARLVPWMGDFLEEMREKGDPAAGLSAAIADGRVFVWWNVSPVSMAGWANPTPNGVRIGPVYTPLEQRRRGYATAVVSALSDTLLRQGKSFCALYTDLSNPTSNSIYQRVGYQPILDCYHYRFIS